MAKSAVTAERFAKGMTFDQYVTYAGSPQNLAREAFGSYYPDGGAKGIPRKDNSAALRERYARTRLADYQVAAIKWLAATGIASCDLRKDWSSDCRRDVRRSPWFAGRAGSPAHLQSRRPEDPRPAPAGPAAYPDTIDLMLEQ
jgi:hypothetical protein